MWRNNLARVREERERCRSQVSCAHVCVCLSVIPFLLSGRGLEMAAGLSTSHISCPRALMPSVKPFFSNIGSLCFLFDSWRRSLTWQERQEAIQIHSRGGKLAGKREKVQLHCLNSAIWWRCFCPCSEQKHAEVSKLLVQIRKMQDITHLVLPVLIKIKPSRLAN